MTWHASLQTVILSSRGRRRPENLLGCRWAVLRKPASSNTIMAIELSLSAVASTLRVLPCAMPIDSSSPADETPSRQGRAGQVGRLPNELSTTTGRLLTHEPASLSERWAVQGSWVGQSSYAGLVSLVTLLLVFNFVRWHFRGGQRTGLLV